MNQRLLIAALLVAPLLARADEFDGKKSLDLDERAAIELDRDEAHKAIDKKYEGDDSSDARRAKGAEYKDADKKVLDDHKVELREYTWQSSHDNPGTQDVLKEKKKDLKEKRDREAQEKALAESKAKEPSEPEVVKGFDDTHPLNLDEPGAPKVKKEPKLDAEGNPIPEVEKGMLEENMEGPKVETGGGEGGEGGAQAGRGTDGPPPGAEGGPPPEDHKKRKKHKKGQGMEAPDDSKGGE